MNIAVTRIGACSALGRTLDETVDALRAGRVGIRTPSDLEQAPSHESGAGEAPLPTEARGPWRAEHALRSTLQELLSEEDRATIRARAERWAMVVGTTLAGMRHCGVGMRADEVGDHARADVAFARTSASAVLSNALAGLDIEVPSVSLSSACASSLAAIAHACAQLRAGSVDAVIAGGYDPISEFAYGGFSALQLVARGPLSPFASDREGMKLGEGVALFVLRRFDDGLPAAERPRVRAIITCAGESTDAHHLTQPHPEGQGAARALSQALASDGTPPELVVAHATGTPANDAAEHLAYRAVFGERLPLIPVVALKSRFGHPLGAAGALEAAAIIACAERSFVPTTAGRGRSRDEFPDLDLLEGDARDAAPSEFVALAAGFGGANAAVRFTRATAARTVPSRQPAPEPCALRIRAVGAVSIAGRGARALATLPALREEHGDWPAFDEATLAALLDRTRARRLSLLARLMVGAVRDLVESSGLEASELRETPLIAANWCGAADYTERYYRELVRSGIDLANPMLFAESVPNIGSAQCALAFGIEAPTASVIGRRTAAVEAIWLAAAKFRTRDWTRAIVVAAEEAHPIVERVLARCAGAPVGLRSGAVALLLERASDAAASDGAAHGRLLDPTGFTVPLDATRAARLDAGATEGLLTSDSPFDEPLRSARAGRADSSAQAIAIPEMGAATALGVLLAPPTQPAERRPIGALDPHGACWIMTHRRG